MENGRNVNENGTQDGMFVKPLEGNGHSRSRTDIMTRRLKNRERQRRYRARKRMEADMKKDCIPNQSTRPGGVVESKGNHNNYISRVHCERNWKKDARRAHASKNVQVAHGAANIAALALNGESQTLCLIPQIAVEAQVERKNNVENSLSFPGSETKAKLGARNWKAEARRKKD